MRYYKSGIIRIGKCRMGGNEPVLIQSMTNTSTQDVEATAEQSKRIIDAGADMVRITARNIREAKLLEEIKGKLLQSGYDAPLIADIHFNPEAAEVAARVVDKVRINPGNYADKKKGKRSYTNQEYRDELNKIRDRLLPLVEICNKNKTAIRIGTNHGSLSERILITYGNTIRGMAESAMEFVRICESLEFTDLVLSMKSSDVRIMVYATRMLVKMMQDEGCDFPLHLGVTEAGSGMDGRIRSAAGIGALLSQGIGDTIRVSLTEAPENEIPVAKNIAFPFLSLRNQEPVNNKLITDFAASGKDYSSTKQVAKYVVFSNTSSGSGKSLADFCNENGIFVDKDGKAADLTFDIIEAKDNTSAPASQKQDDKKDKAAASSIRLAEFKMDDCSENKIVRETAKISAMLIDGKADGIFVNVKRNPDACINSAFSLLQFLKLRITKTEYIACPTCGRTQYDIIRVLQEIKEKTSHLKGLKIAVMGCIVNGPGEMADADYGYVGSAPGKVCLYKSGKQVKANIREGQAIDALIDLIKSSGDWKEL